MSSSNRADLEVAKAHLMMVDRHRERGAEEFIIRRLEKDSDKLGLQDESGLIWHLARAELDLEELRGCPWPGLEYDIQPVGGRLFKYRVTLMFDPPYEQPMRGRQMHREVIPCFNLRIAKRAVKLWQKKYDEQRERAHNLERELACLEPVIYNWREYDLRNS